MIKKSIGRNDPCPCGSGLKFKKCCIAKEEHLSACFRLESTAMRNAIDWLTQNYQLQANNAIQNEFFGSVEKSDRERLDRIPSKELQGRIRTNVFDWLINESSLEVEGVTKPVYDLLLDADERTLSKKDLECLKQMREIPLSLYEVQSVKPGDGVELVDLIQKESKPVWVIDRVASNLFSPSDIFGTRLFRRDFAFVTSDAVYPISRDDALVCVDKISREVKGRSAADLVRPKICQHIRESWLEEVVAQSLLLVSEESPETVKQQTSKSLSWLAPT
jgi:hypothetical protein